MFVGVMTNVRFGSKADVTLLNFDVRFTPESGHSPTRSGCLLWAKSGLMHRSKFQGCWPRSQLKHRCFLTLAQERQ